LKIEPFRLERYFAEHEFSVTRQLSCSDCETLSLNRILNLLDEKEKNHFMNISLGYTESNGSLSLREEIASLYQGFNPDEVFVAAPEECIYLTLNSLLEKGDRVMFISPIYQSFEAIPDSLGCETVKWHIKNCNGEWTLDIGFLEEEANKGLKALCLNFPHNPTGFIPSLDEYKQIIEIARKYNIFIFSDEIYWLLEHGGRAPLPACCTLYENSVSLFGMSKTFGLPGLRIGWIATRKKDLYSKIANMKDYTTICSSALSEEVAGIALRHRNYFIARSSNIIRNNLDYAQSVFDDFPDIIHWNEPSGGSVAFPCFREGISSSAAAETLIKEHDLLMLPGSLFSYDDRYFRLGLGRKEFSDSLFVFKKYIASTF
jgi:aspartate/methionine/tyrosine aminotransferase